MMQEQKATVQMPVCTPAAGTAAVVEGIIKLPEQLEAVQIVGCSARIAGLTAAAGEETAALEGQVEFTVVFLTPQGAMDSVTGLSGFTHRMYAQGMRSGMHTQVQAALTAPAARIASADRIAVEAGAEITVQGFGGQECQVLCHAGSEDAYFTGATQYWYESTVVHTAGMVLRDDVMLPDNCPDAVKLLQVQAQAQVQQTQVLAGSVNISGAVTLVLLYSTAERPFARTEVVLPYDHCIELAALREDMEVYCRAAVSRLTVDLHETGEGRRRILAVEAPLEFVLEAYAPRQSPMLEDGWHRTRRLELSTVQLQLHDAPITMNAAVNVTQELHSVPLSDEAEQITALCTAAVDGWGVRSGGAEFNGRLHLQIFASDQGTPVSTWVEAPFEAAVEWDMLEPDGMLRIEPGICRAEVWRAGGQWQVRAAVEVCLHNTPVTCLDVLQDVQPGEVLENAGAPLVLCVVQPGDTLWALSKRCRISCDDILACNPTIAESGLQPGMKVLALRKKA